MDTNTGSRGGRRTDPPKSPDLAQTTTQKKGTLVPGGPQKKGPKTRSKNIQKRDVENNCHYANQEAKARSSPKKKRAHNGDLQNAHRRRSSQRAAKGKPGDRSKYHGGRKTQLQLGPNKRTPPKGSWVKQKASNHKVKKQRPSHGKAQRGENHITDHRKDGWGRLQK